MHERLDSDPAQRAWFRPVLARLAAVRRSADERLRTFFSGDAPLLAARAPGRLDVLGGIADYSGALVLQLPLDRATFAVVQAQAAPRLDVVTFREERPHVFTMELEPLLTGSLRTPEALAARFAPSAADHWAGYVVGLVHYGLQRLAHRLPGRPHGVRLLIDSQVPEGKGVSSSAALEVACMSALAAVFEIELYPEELAAACQWVENHIVGAPCGIMDQMTSTCGQPDRLLRLLCQPGTVEGYVEIPAGYRFYGIDSGIRHAVTGADYGTVRTAAFMGYRIIAEAAGFSATPAGTRVQVEDPVWHGYLANISPEQYEDRFRDLLPEEMSGALFLERYGGLTDTVTRVDPERRYPVRQATAHPIYEDERVRRGARLLELLPHRREAADELGRLMYESHASYGACGLGSAGTDLLVKLAASAGPDVFGAKITGGGSGGTVAVFGTDAAEPVVRDLARRYAAHTGRAAEVFTGSSPGAAELGLLRVDPSGQE